MKNLDTKYNSCGKNLEKDKKPKREVLDLVTLTDPSTHVQVYEEEANEALAC